MRIDLASSLIRGTSESFCDLDLESALVASRYDAATGVNHFTIESGSSYATAAISDAELAGCGPVDDEDGRAARRRYVARKLLLNAQPDANGGNHHRCFSPIAERNAGLEISASRLEVELERLAKAIEALGTLEK